MKEYYPSTRVIVFDTSLYKNDKDTPYSVTMRSATVVCWYGTRSTYNANWIYESLIDIVFDHKPDTVSKGHFTERVEIIK